MEITTTLTQFISSQLLADQQDANLGPEDNLLLSGLIDSLGVMRLVNFIEAEFELEVPPQDVTIENFQSVSILAAYLENRLQVTS